MRRTRPTIMRIGSVSSGTMWEEDLIPSLLWECDQLRLTKSERRQVSEIKRRIDREGYYGSEEAHYDLNETLWDILNDHVPIYCYFGAHPGDGADYGVWLDEGFSSLVVGNGGIKVGGLEDVPTGYTGEALIVNDHGNCTLYAYRRGRRREVWSVV